MTTCTPCSEVLAARHRWATVPRQDLPDSLRNPDTELEFNLAYGVITAGTGIEPICEDDCLTGWKQGD